MGGCEGTGWPGIKVCPGRFKTAAKLMTVNDKGVHVFFDFIYFLYGGWFRPE